MASRRTPLAHPSRATPEENKNACLEHGGPYFQGARLDSGKIFQTFVITLNNFVRAALDNTHFRFNFAISLTGDSLILSTIDECVGV
jgi:hypothetical protein